MKILFVCVVWFSIFTFGSSAADVTRIAFGSCLVQGAPAPILDAVVEARPDVFVWMGDNVYADTTDMEKMAADYARQAARPAYRQLCERTAITGTWDDHDYGANDAGKEYSMRAEAQTLLLDFLRVPPDDPRRHREGVYGSETYGEGDHEVKVILLDTRYFRDAPGPQGDILGEAQWAWLEEELVGSTATVNIVVSSIQVIANGHRFEKWANFPAAQRRLYALLARPKVPPVVLLSGDRHHGEISSLHSETLGYELVDVTSSSLNRSTSGNVGEFNPHRRSPVYGRNNFGLLTIDWSRERPVLTALICSEQGSPVRAHTWALVRPE